MADEVMAEVEQQTATRGPAPGGVAPWVEKYRPATIDELQQQDQVALPQPPPLCQLYTTCYSRQEQSNLGLRIPLHTRYAGGCAVQGGSALASLCVSLLMFPLSLYSFGCRWCRR